MNMKTYWISTTGTNYVVGPGQFRDVNHMMSTAGALCYTKAQRSESLTVQRAVAEMPVGAEIKSQRAWHPRHGAEFATIKRIA